MAKGIVKHERKLKHLRWRSRHILMIKRPGEPRYKTWYSGSFKEMSKRAELALQGFDNPQPTINCVSLG